LPAPLLGEDDHDEGHDDEHGDGDNDAGATGANTVRAIPVHATAEDGDDPRIVVPPTAPPTAPRAASDVGDEPVPVERSGSAVPRASSTELGETAEEEGEGSGAHQEEPPALHAAVETM
jgi:hypothetical protein